MNDISEFTLIVRGQRNSRTTRAGVEDVSCTALTFLARAFSPRVARYGADRLRRLSYQAASASHGLPLSSACRGPFIERLARRPPE